MPCRRCARSATRASASTPSTRRAGSPRHRALHPARPERRRRRRPRTRRCCSPSATTSWPATGSSARASGAAAAQRGAGGPRHHGHDARHRRPRQHRPRRRAARRGVRHARRGAGTGRRGPESGIEQLALDDLLAQSDHVTLHCALSPRHAGPDRRAGAGPAAADRGPDQHRPRRDRRLRCADRGAPGRPAVGRRPRRVPAGAGGRPAAARASARRRDTPHRRLPARASTAPSPRPS